MFPNPSVTRGFVVAAFALLTLAGCLGAEPTPEPGSNTRSTVEPGLECPPAPEPPAPDGSGDLDANAGPNQRVPAGAAVTLDGSRSSDRLNRTLAFQWVQLEGPCVELSGEQTAHPGFRAPEPPSGYYRLRFRLVVEADGAYSGPDIVEVRSYAGAVPTA